MGILLKNIHVSKFREISYELAIHDNMYNGTPIDFNLRGDGFSLRYQGNDDRFAPFVASKVSFGVVVQNLAIDTALQEVINSSEGRFFIIIKKGSAINWIGRLFYEEFSRENKPYPYTFNLSFTDGLASLKAIEYDNVGGFTRQVLIDIVLYCLGKLDTVAYFSLTDRFLITSVNWIEFNQNITATEDALALTNVDYRAFLLNDETTELLSCYDVLKEICIIFGARLIQSEGVFRFVQINELAKATIKEIRYATDKTIISTSPNTSLSVQINDINRKLGGGSFRYKPSLKGVKLTYRHKSDNNFASAIKWDANNEMEFTLGDFEFGENDEIFVRLKIHYTVKLNTYITHYLRWRFTLRVGIYWLKREVEIKSDSTIKMNPVSWETSESYFEIVDHDGRNELEDYRKTIELSFQTPSMPVEEGQVKVKLEGVGAVYYNRVIHDTSNVELSAWATGSKTVIELLNGGDISLRENSRTYEIENTDFPNSSIIKEVSTKIGDGTTKTSLAKLQVFDGSTWVDSMYWSVGEINENRLIQELLIREILRGRKKTRAYIEMSFIALFGAHEVLQYDGKRFALAQATFKSNRDTWDGTWFEIGDATGAYFPTGGTIIKPPIPNTDDLVEYENIDNDPISLSTQNDKNLIANLLGLLTDAKTNNLIVQDTPISEILIEDLPTATDLREGDRIKIIDPFTGLSETVTLTANTNATDTSRYTTGDTTLFIEQFTPTFNFHEASYLVKDVVASESTPTNQTLKRLNQTGAYIDVPFDLPIAANEVDEKLVLQRTFATGIYEVTYNIENNDNGERRRIRPMIPFDNEAILIKLTA